VSKRTKYLLGIGVIAALVIGWQVAAFANFPAGHVLLTLSGSDFEIDADANLQVDHTGDVPPPPATPLPEMIDWQNEGANTFRTGVQQAADTDSGPGDESFGQGTKEDTAVPSVVDGSIPPNKSDLKAFGIYVEEDEFLNLFWSRVQDPEGTTNMDFELNQKFCGPDVNDVDNDGNTTEPNPQTCTANGITPIRTGDGIGTGVDDILITYDLSRGGTVATISIRKWSGSAWGPAVELDQQSEAVGSINTSPIAASALGALSPRTFGEAQVSFEALFGDGACGTFGSAYLKSRSSDSFTAALKDFVPPREVEIGNCPAQLETTASADVIVGGNLTDSATLTTEDGADGTITFRLYGPFTTAPDADADCIASGTGENLIESATQTRTVTNHNVTGAGNTANPYTTATPYVATAAGFYEWTAEFDATTPGIDDVPETDCGDPDEQIQVANAPSEVTSAQSWVPSDSATIVGHGGGTVTFTLLKGVNETDCLTPPAGGYPAGSVIYTSNAVTVPAGNTSQTVSTDDATTQPPAVTAATGDTYRWKVAYSGTTGFDPATFCKETTALTINNTGS
jgi:hypothetical protein